MSKIPSYQEAVDEIGPAAMSFFMEMVDQGNRPEEESSVDEGVSSSPTAPESELPGPQTRDLPNAVLPRPQTVAEAKRLPKETHFVDPKGRRRKR